tara:strand:+ start:159 stop:449 length:291 start_codon:yes stop_codon:yes gene_type:complete
MISAQKLVYYYMGEYKTHKVTLYNDDVLSFQYVVGCLIEICKHTPIQAEQCALIAHEKGQIDIASGSFDKMYEILETLDHVNIEASLEEYESNLYR